MGLFFISEKFLCGQEESPIQILSEKMVVLWRFLKASSPKARLGMEIKRCGQGLPARLLIQDFCKFSDLVSEVGQLPSPPLVVVTSVVYFEKAYN